MLYTLFYKGAHKHKSKGTAYFHFILMLVTLRPKMFLRDP